MQSLDLPEGPCGLRGVDIRNVTYDSTLWIEIVAHMQPSAGRVHKDFANFWLVRIVDDGNYIVADAWAPNNLKDAKAAAQALLDLVLARSEET